VTSQRARRTGRWHAVLLSAAIALSACTTQAVPVLPRSVSVTLDADGESRRLTTEAATVQELLTHAGITLNGLDRVSPSEVAALADGMTVAVTRVLEDTQVVTQTVPFGKQVVRDADVPEGEAQLLQSGRSGVLARHYRITYENSVETGRVLTREELVQEPRDEVRLIGTKAQMRNVPVSGTLAYLSGQDAWVVRESSFQVRRLTSFGDLDGRVFTLSEDGSRLVFTRSATETDVLNETWMVRTTEASPNPVPLGLRDVVWAAWSPTEDQIAWSSAEVVEPAPGWRGKNDLWRATVTSRNTLVSRREIVEAGAGGGYGWWGTRYAWAPDGDALAFSKPESVGIIPLPTGDPVTIADFAGYRTFSSWAWNPEPGWTPTSDLLALVIHDGGDPDEPEESPVFNLLLTDPTGTTSATLAMEVGMWSTPRFSPNGEMLLFGRALVPYQSATSPYALFLADRDGSGQRQVYGGQDGGLALPEWSWHPEGHGIAFIELGDVRLLPVGEDDLAIEVLTDDGNITQFVWR